ncbi:dienelactone hydrolase [Leptospira levettii]|uniref:dienelactone hydrolase family protein n=1 Tax=Leptospira levettii TaxID=2023178 RepID=UPI0010824E12|nr:dienelactone hydrolase family protein [Leptospira levettii]TGM73573.1 dienelactone hydrolase [Leptospira levettii]
MENSLPPELAEFLSREMTIGGITKTVYVSGDGPAVIVMPEMPGISPDVIRFTRWVRDAGFTVYLPSLFGKDGAIPEAREGIVIFKRACVSSEFSTLASNGSSPIVDWLRGLANQAHAESGGRGVGAIGMCFTGNFALTMMLEPSMLAPVLCQPSLPLDDPAGINMSPSELNEVKKRLRQESLDILAFRFSGDKHCRSERFRTYKEEFGDLFIDRVLPDSAANPSPPPFFDKVIASPHSVVTAHLIDEIGQPTLKARDEILSFLKRKLKD